MISNLVCIFCEKQLETLEGLKEHSGLCKQHPLFPEKELYVAKYYTLRNVVEDITRKLTELEELRGRLNFCLSVVRDLEHEEYKQNREKQIKLDNPTGLN